MSYNSDNKVIAYYYKIDNKDKFTKIDDYLNNNEEDSSDENKDDENNKTEKLEEEKLNKANKVNKVEDNIEIKDSLN